MNHLIDIARHLPLSAPLQTISISPVTLPVPGRSQPLEMRITAPINGTDLPVIILSHGHGPSLYLPSKDGYGPLVNFYAEQGFVVIQPTHANSKIAGLGANAPGAPLFWRERVEELQLIAQQLAAIEASVPAIAGRLDRSKLAAVGHSLGGHSVSMLLGARLTDPKDPNAVDVNAYEARVKVGVLLGAPGNGGADLSAYAAEHFSACNLDFSYLTTPTLVVAGELDKSEHLTVRGPSWHTDPYHCSPGADALLMLAGGGHGMGGISGYDAKEADDESPDRLATTQRMTSAYLRSALYKEDRAWVDACNALKAEAGSLGWVESK